MLLIFRSLALLFVLSANFSLLAGKLSNLDLEKEKENSPRLSQPSYIESDLSLWGQETEIHFYHRDDPDTKNGEYSSVVIMSTQPKLDNLRLKAYEAGSVPIYYYPLDNEEGYEGLSHLLNEFAESREKPSVKRAAIPEPDFTAEVSFEELIADLKASQNVCITFGAGISAGYVPTLIEFFDSLGLEKVISDDAATEESIIKFANAIVDNRDACLRNVQEVWSKVQNCKVETTPSHEALAKIITQLKYENKNIFVYTDNVDGIHDRLNIKLSETHVPEEGITKTDYPPAEILNKGKTTVLVCGQSFDLLGVLATINTRCLQAPRFYALNIAPTAIRILDGFDIDNQPDNIEMLAWKNLQMNWIKGPLQETFSELLDRLSQPK